MRNSFSLDGVRVERRALPRNLSASACPCRWRRTPCMRRCRAGAFRHPRLCRLAGAGRGAPGGRAAAAVPRARCGSPLSLTGRRAGQLRPPGAGAAPAPGRDRAARAGAGIAAGPWPRHRRAGGCAVRGAMSKARARNGTESRSPGRDHAAACEGPQLSSPRWKRVPHPARAGGGQGLAQADAAGGRLCQGPAGGRRACARCARRDSRRANAMPGYYAGSEISGRDSTQMIAICQIGRAGRGRPKPDNGLAGAGGGGSAIGGRDRRIIRMVCGEGFAPWKLMRAACGDDYKHTTRRGFARRWMRWLRLLGDKGKARSVSTPLPLARGGSDDGRRRGRICGSAGAGPVLRHG